MRCRGGDHGRGGMKGQWDGTGRVWLEGLSLGCGNWRAMLEEADPL